MQGVTAVAGRGARYALFSDRGTREALKNLCVRLPRFRRFGVGQVARNACRG